jgi:hypothetical protein
MLTNDWQTLQEIKRATKKPADAVIKAVQAAYKNGLAECRFMEKEGVKIAEWRRKHGIL